MNSEQKQKLKKNKAVDAVLRIACGPLFWIQSIKANRAAKARRNGKIVPRYSWIKELKNKYEGNRCFVVATGPSITVEDLELIKSEYSFGMNSCVLAYDKTAWRPSFYAIQDEYVYEKLEKTLSGMPEDDLNEAWISDSIAKRFDVPNRFKIFPLHYLDHKMFHRKGYGTFKFSDDCYNCVYDAYSITFSILQMACYMGFKEVYLLGCDCNYNQEKTHFIEYDYKDPKAAIMGDKMIQAHYRFKQFADSLGVKIVNCTRGGMLEVYPRMTLEEVLKN